ncbi:MAG: hypothetical protein IJZ19_10280, partial [Lentisphaeria bacterium]|nr:hypothetical protein [Lentisphaeria bacterium]
SAEAEASAEAAPPANGNLLSFQREKKVGKEKVEGVLILWNSSLKLKTVVDNAILLNYAVSSENIS